MMRVFFAFLIAPVAGSLTFAGMAALSDYLYAVPFQRINIFTLIAPLIIGGYPIAMFLGVPGYLLLRKRVKARLATVTLIGGIIAALPWLAGLTLMSLNSTGLSKWVELMRETTVPAFGCGCISGSVFWLIAHKE